MPFEAAAEHVKVIKNAFVVLLGMQTEKVLNLRTQRKTPDCTFSYFLCVDAKHRRQINHESLCLELFQYKLKGEKEIPYFYICTITSSVIEKH